MRIDQIASDVVVDAFGNHVDETQAGAPCNRGRIGRTKRQDGEERGAGKLGRKASGFPGVFVRGSQVDQRRVNEHLAENPLELFGRAG